MSAVIKPLRRHRKTAWRKKYLTQNQRWGKITVTKMPVPEGFITTSKIWTGEAEEVPLPEEPTETEQKEEVRDEDVE